MIGKNLSNELPYDFLVEFQDKLRLAEEKIRNIDDVAMNVNGLIKELALFYDADCAFVMEIDWDLGIGFTAFSFCVEGIQPIPQKIISIPLEKLGGWGKKLRNNQPVFMDVEKLIRECQEWNKEGAWYNLSSLMITPFMKHLNAGLVVVGNPKKYWYNMSFLTVVASMIVSDMNELKLQERVDVAVKRIAQQTEADVLINCFGGMEIKGSKGILTDENITGDQCYRLLAYMIFNRSRTKPVRELADIIWNDIPIVDPYKDVKNVVYRLKRLLSIIELEDLVIGMSGTFIINPKYQLLTDYERFEDICNIYFRESDPAVQSRCFHTARQLYKGSLLPKCDHVHWFIPRIGFYQSMYLQLLKKYLSMKLKETDYLAVQKIALEGLNDEPYDTDFMMYHIICMLQQGNRSLAKNYYYRMAGEFTEEQKEMIQGYWI